MIFQKDCRMSFKGLIWNLSTLNFYSFIIAAFVTGLIAIAVWIR